MEISDILKIWKHTHKAGRVLEKPIHACFYRLKIGKDVLGPNSLAHRHLFLHCNIVHKKMETRIKSIEGWPGLLSQVSI